MQVADDLVAMRPADGVASFDLVRATMLKSFPQLCRALGGRPEQLLNEAGVAARDEAALPENVTYREFVNLLTVAARQLDCDDFGMRLAISQSGTALYGPLGMVMRHSQTLGDALEYVVAHAHVHSPAARITRHTIPGRGGIVFSHEIVVGAFASQEQAMEHVLLSGHLGAMELTGGRARARQVLLRHRRLSSPAVYHRNFGCEVLFDQPLDAIIFSREDLRQPIVSRNRRVHAEIIASIAEQTCAPAAPTEAAVRAAVLRLMPVGLANNVEVARDLGMNTRTLHRRLRESGTSFQKIKDDVRCELIRYYVARPELSFLWITGKLDFAEQAVFTRFCLRHLGMTPTALREQALMGVSQA